MSTPSVRPWYVSDRLTDEWLDHAARGENLSMRKIQTWIRAIVVNVGLITVSLYALHLGAEPTIIGSIGLLSLGLYNGLELSDYLSLLQAIAEARDEVSNSEGD